MPRPPAEVVKTPEELRQEQQHVCIGMSFCGVIFAIIIGVNIWFWASVFIAKAERGSLIDGTCKFLSSKVEKDGWRSYHGVPMVGRHWSDVPCKVEAKFWNAKGHVLDTASNYTWFTFFYDQDNRLIHNYLTDTCDRLMQHETKVGKFDCSYKLNHAGEVEQGYEYHVSSKEFPNLITQYLMEALGLTLFTFGPCVCLLSHWARRQIMSKCFGVSGSAVAAAEPSPYRQLPGSDGAVQVV